MDINTLSAADLDTLFAEKYAALQALRQGEPTPAQITEALGLADECRNIRARQNTLASEAAAFAALDDKEFEPVAVEPVEPVVEPVEPVAVEPVAPVEPVVEPVEPVAAEPSIRSQVAAATQRPTAPSVTPTGSTIITAAGEGTGVPMGHKFEGLAEVAMAALAKMQSFPTPDGNGQSEDIKYHPIAKFTPQFSSDLVIDHKTADDMEVLYRAADETRLPGNSLTAALGWCAPSETMYDLKADESLEGILSLPEVQVKRGGMRYTVGPQFADFYAQAGFIITETQAIAGATKPCYTVACPPFTDVRLDAVGVCIKTPFLVDSAYPELTRRFTSGTLIAHEHMVNANVIQRMLALTPAARVFAGLGSSVDDALEALEIVVAQRRQKYRLPLNRSMEAVIPHWLRGVYRADISRRMGLNLSEIATDAILLQHLAARGIAPQFVYDWQDLDETAEVYPATYNVLVYPSGTFVKGVSDVVNLSAIYDAASLATNTYTGLFVEKGLLVAKVQYDADLITLPICNAGRRGAQNITCA